MHNCAQCDKVLTTVCMCVCMCARVCMSVYVRALVCVCRCVGLFPCTGPSSPPRSAPSLTSSFSPLTLCTRYAHSGTMYHMGNGRVANAQLAVCGVHTVRSVSARSEVEGNIYDNGSLGARCADGSRLSLSPAQHSLGPDTECGYRRDRVTPAHDRRRHVCPLPTASQAGASRRSARA